MSMQFMALLRAQDAKIADLSILVEALAKRVRELSDEQEDHAEHIASLSPARGRVAPGLKPVPRGGAHG